MASIERTLLTWILGALSLGALLVALLTYVLNRPGFPGGRLV